MANWLGKFNTRQQLAKPATPHRDAGDAARDLRDWYGAAAAYRNHLTDHAGDVAIWIQLGHAHKELGDYNAALSAYEQARQIQPADADLLLNLGHLHKLMDNLPEASRYYGASALIDGNAEARVEFERLSLEVPIEPEIKEEMLAKSIDVMATVRERCHGLVPTLISDIDDRDASGLLHGVSNDPWIEFAFDPPLPEGCRAIYLNIDIVENSDTPPSEGRLYIDHGSGYQERNAIVLGDTPELRRLLLVMPETIARLRWDPDTTPSAFELIAITATPIVDIADARTLLKSGGAKEISLAGQMLALESLFATKPPSEDTIETLQLRLSPKFDICFDYEYWRARYVEPTPADYSTMWAMTENMAIKPKFSFIVPTYNTPPDLLAECIQSLLDQTYQNFEICLSDDNSPNPEVAQTLRRFAARDDRVKIHLRTKNGHISANSNSALAMATGDFIVLVDHDDLLPNYALFVVAYYINLNPQASIFFSDEDKISVDGNRFDPYFKGAFNRYLMYGHNMVSHLGVYRRSVVEKVGRFRQGFEGSQDYDLTLRCYEEVGDQGIVHIPHVLYHWRAIPGSTALSADQKGYAVLAAERAINGHFERTGANMRSVQGFANGLTALKPTREMDQSVSIIIPTRDGLDVLRPCVQSILDRDHANVEIIILDNQSEEPETLTYLRSLARRSDVRIVPYKQPFNFSAINNHGADVAKGEILCFLNNDTEVVSDNWLERARMILSDPHVGMVGAKLLFPDGHVQHFGIGLGMADHKVAGTPHAGLPAQANGYFGKARLIQEMGAVTAACMFVRKADFQKLGGFDTDFRVAYNDVDLCVRYTQAGHRIVCDPDITLIHKESRTRGSDASGANRARLDAEAALMRERWATQLDNDLSFSSNLALDRPDFALAYPPRVPMPWCQAI